MQLDLDALTVDCPACVVGQTDCAFCDLSGRVSISAALRMESWMTPAQWYAVIWLALDCMLRELLIAALGVPDIAPWRTGAGKDLVQ